MRTEEELVTSAYRLLLNRDPEPDGLRHWQRMLTGGMTREDFLVAIIVSPEFRKKIGLPKNLDKYDDVDLIIPLDGQSLRVPASDRSLVPSLLAGRQWEPHLSQYLRSCLAPDHLFMDVGANLGYFSVTCAPLVATVVAFEPVPAAFRYCEMNVALNRLRNVQLFPYGLWSEDASIGMMIERTQLAGSYLRQDVSGDISVKCVSLDSLISKGELQLSRLDVLKIDVEGAEASVLEGMRRTIASLRPTILLEVNRPMSAHFGRDVSEIWFLLKGLSYRLEAFLHWHDDSRQPIQDLSGFECLCPADRPVDILAIPEREEPLTHEDDAGE